MPIKIERLVVFGDSLSDIGVKRNTYAGKFASAFALMRTNQVNRYSDNRNWTDWLWEWAGGGPLIIKDKATSDQLAAKHLAWGLGANHGSDHGLLFYANYAEGGAMGGSDESHTGLGYFAEQVARYKSDVQKAPPKGEGLYLVWFGLNDVVTHGRHQKGMAAVATEIATLCKSILQLDPKAHFLIANLPNPQGAVRFRDLATTETAGFQEAAFELSFRLAKEIPAKLGAKGALLDIYSKMEHVDRNVGAYGLTAGAQPHGIEVYYGKPPKNAAAARMTATSDDAHPTEQVYALLAKIWAEAILESYDVGTLRSSGEGVFPIHGKK